MVDNILNTAPNVVRTITKTSPKLTHQNETPTARLVVLSGTGY